MNIFSCIMSFAKNVASQSRYFLPSKFASKVFLKKSVITHGVSLLDLSYLCVILSLKHSLKSHTVIETFSKISQQGVENHLVQQ
jgi:hypothetical protein